MSSFEIDDEGVDTAALEEKVRQAIEAKRGVRFTDEELDELRRASLEPRLRREDLPKGLLDELGAVRARLPEVPPPPGIHLVPEQVNITDRGPGIKGRLAGIIRGWALRFHRSTLRLEHYLQELIETTNEQGSWAGKQFSEMTGQLDRWRERDLHLMHNLVFELTNLKIDLQHMQDRINELARRVDMLAERERALEKLTVGDDTTAGSGTSGG